MGLRKTLFGIVLLGLALIISGCGGSPKAPAPEKGVVSGGIYAPVDQLAKPSFSLWKLLEPVAVASLGEQPLAGAKVIALDLSTFNQVGLTAETDSSGKYRISGLPKGINVMIVAKKERTDGKTLRISNIAVGVDTNTTADANPATTLASEVIANKVRKHKQFQVTTGVVEAANSSAQNIVEDLIDIDLTEGGTILGAAGDGLNPEFSGAVVIEGSVQESMVPSADSQAVHAAIQSIRDASHSIESAVNNQLAVNMSSISEILPNLGEFGICILEALESEPGCEYIGEITGYTYELLTDEASINAMVVASDGVNLKWSS